MKKINIIGIDLYLLDEKTGEFKFKMTIDKEFIKDFNVDIEELKKDIEPLIDNLTNCIMGEE